MKQVGSQEFRLLFRRGLVLSFFSLTLLGFLVGGGACHSSKQSIQQKINEGQVFKRSISDDVRTLDPANAFDAISLAILPNIMETLYQYDYRSKTVKIIPQLAEKMPQVSSDRLTITIPIKKGIFYADDSCFDPGTDQSTDQGADQPSGLPSGQKRLTREVVADDFIFAFKRLAHPTVLSQGTWIFENRVQGFDEFMNLLKKTPPEKLEEVFNREMISGFKAIDSHTLQIKLTKPYPQLLYMLTMNFTSPTPPEAIRAYADAKRQWVDHPVGTGAFRLEKWTRGHEVVLVRNPQYREDKMPDGWGENSGKRIPFLDRVVFSIIRESQPSWLKFLKGEFDIAGIPKDNYSQAIEGGVGNELSPEFKKKGIFLDIVPGPVAYWISFNVNDSVLKNKYLRQALSSAVDRTKWIEIFTNNRGHPQTTVAPPGLSDRVENSKMKYGFDLERAKALLKKAGYSDGKDVPSITMEMRGADSLSRQMGDFFTQQFAQIGVKVEMSYNSFPAYLEKSKGGRIQMSLGGWILDYPDVENMYQLLYGPNRAPGPNEAAFNHPEYNQMYQKLSVMDPGPQRAKLVQQMDELVQEESPWGFGFYRDEFTLAHGWLENYHANPYIRDGLKYYRINLEKKKELLSKM